MHSGLDQFLAAGAGGSSFHQGLEYCPAKPQCANACGYLLPERGGPARDGPCNDARMKLCGAGFAFSRSGDLCLLSEYRRN